MTASVRLAGYQLQYVRPAVPTGIPWVKLLTHKPPWLIDLGCPPSNPAPGKGGGCKVYCERGDPDCGLGMVSLCHAQNVALIIQ